MALEATCNEQGGNFFCSQLADCVIQQLSNVSFDGVVSGCTQFMVLGTNGIVTPVTEPYHYLTGQYVGPPIIHPATAGVGVVVNIPFNSIVQNDFCTFIHDGVTVEVTKDGYYRGDGILITGNFPPVVTVADFFNVQIDILMSGTTVGTLSRAIAVQKAWGFAGPFHFLHFKINESVFINAGTLLTANVIAEGSTPFTLEYIGMTLRSFELCPCS